MIKKLIMIVVGIAAAMGIAAVPANASTSSFLSSLSAHGFQDVYDYPQMWISSAYQVCDQLQYNNGAVVVDWLAAQRNDRSEYWANVFMWDAIDNVCPWHDHSGRGSLYA